MRNSRYWMGQTDWFIDNAGSREATGADAGHPIPELERQFRMGPYPTWNPALEYHLRYLTDTDTVVLQGTKAPSSSTIPIFIHGSATNGQGQSTLHSGTVDAPLSTLNYLTNQPWEITSSAIPTSWTASSLVNARIRLTSGSPGAVGWSMVDLTGKKARCSEFNVPATYTAAGFTALSGRNAATPAIGNTFVVERLSKISRLFVNIDMGVSSFSLSNPVVFESLDLGSAGFTSGGGTGRYYFIGCALSIGSVGASVFPSLFVHGCQINPPMPISNALIRITGGYAFGQDLYLASLFGGRIERFMVQGNRTVVTQSGGLANDSGGWHIVQFGAMNCSTALEVKSPGLFLNNSSGDFSLWGSGNFTAMNVRPGCTVIVFPFTSAAVNFPISATTDVKFGAEFITRTTCPAYDPSLGLYTPERTLSWANICAEQSAGGFCLNGLPGQPRISDPLTGAQIMVKD